MKLLRSVAYAIIAICIIGCIVIIKYEGKGVSYTYEDSAASISEAVAVFDESLKEYHYDFPEIEEKEEEKTGTVASVTVSSTSTSNIENNSGEISYSEIVRLQEEEKLKEQKVLVSKSNEKNGITTSTSTSKTSTSTSTPKEYKYVVNKETGMIHRIGCLNEPTGENALYYEKLSEAIKAGYKIKCTICSP